MLWCRSINSIMKNDVWVIVSRSMGKLVIDFGCLYKMKHAIDERHREIQDLICSENFPRERELTTRYPLL